MFNINEFARGDMFRGVCTAVQGKMSRIEAVGDSGDAVFLCKAYIPQGSKGLFSYEDYNISSEGTRVFVSLDSLEEEIEIEIA